jgi:type III pantothenate kinase
MLLVFDIGNSNIVAGVYEGEKLIADWRLATDRQKTIDEYGVLIQNLFHYKNLATDQVKAAVISSVVPPLTNLFEEVMTQYFKVTALVVGPGMKTGLSIKYENPREVGADRVVNAVAGIRLYGSPLIIVDFGTATTFCAISESGDWLGGAIAPGLGIASEALFQRTAKLPRVEITKPRTAIGKNTVNSIQSGLYFGYIGLVENLITKLKVEMGCNPTVIATGGFAQLIAAESKLIDKINPDLTLEGLRFLYETNKISN